MRKRALKRRGGADSGPEAFWVRVDRSGGDEACWLWKLHADKDGYGIFTARTDDRVWMERAHRRAYELARGTIPPGLYVCHRCDVPRCCNPLHLFLGTNSENIKDCVRKGRHRTSFPTKLTPEQIAHIRAIPLDLVNRAAIAEAFGVSKAHVTFVRRES